MKNRLIIALTVLLLCVFQAVGLAEDFPSEPDNEVATETQTACAPEIHHEVHNEEPSASVEVIQAAPPEIQSAEVSKEPSPSGITLVEEAPAVSEPIETESVSDVSAIGADHAVYGAQQTEDAEESTDAAVEETPDTDTTQESESVEKQPGIETDAEEEPEVDEAEEMEVAAVSRDGETDEAVATEPDISEEDDSFFASVEYTATLGLVEVKANGISVYRYIKPWTATDNRIATPATAEFENVGPESYVRITLNNHVVTLRDGTEMQLTGGTVVSDVYTLDEGGAPVDLDYTVTADGTIYVNESLPTGAVVMVDYYGCYDYQKEYVGTNYSRKIAVINASANVEAIQAVNFTPDYSEDDPWHGVVVEDDGKESADPVMTLSVIAEGDEDVAAELLDSDGKTLLSVSAEDGEEEVSMEDPGYVFPGDNITLSTALTVSGDTESKQDVSHTLTIVAEMKELVTSLIDTVKVLLRVNEEKDYREVGIYKPTEDSLVDATLGRFNSGDILQILYNLHVKEELDNKYQSESFTVRAEYAVHTATPKPTRKPSSTPVPATTPKTVSTVTIKEYRIPLTGVVNMTEGDCFN